MYQAADTELAILTWLRGLGPDAQETESNSPTLDAAAMRASEALGIAPVETLASLNTLKQQGLVQVTRRPGYSGIYRTSISEEGRQLLQRQVGTFTRSGRPTVFVSCGQYTEEERQLGCAIADVITARTPAVGYFAQNQSSLEGVTDHILSALSACVGFVGIMHRRGTIAPPGGSPFDRASVWVEQEIAIAAFIVQIMQRPVKVQLYIQKGIGREGLRDKVLLNAYEFENNNEVLDHFRQHAQTLFGGVASEQAESGYKNEIDEAVTDACGQGGLLIFSFVCSFRLIVHPTERIANRLSDEQLRTIIDVAKATSGGVFPRVGTNKSVNLADGLEVVGNLETERGVFREQYRFLHDGLFTYVCVSPDDIGPDKQYIGSDRFVGFGTLVSTVRSMTRFASALAQAYGAHTTAEIQVSGLLNHALKDDTADATLFMETPTAPSRVDYMDSQFDGTPDAFQSGSDEWALDTIVRCMRLLNFPGTADGARGRIRALLDRLAL